VYTQMVGDWSDTYSTTSRSLVIDGQESGRWYEAQVRAVSAAGASSWKTGPIVRSRGDIATVTISVLDAPDPPFSPERRRFDPSLSPGVPAHAAIRVSWTHGNDGSRPPITGWDIRYSTDTATVQVELARDDVSGGIHRFDYSVDGLTADTEYRFEVRARNVDGVSDWVRLGEIRTAPAP